MRSTTRCNDRGRTPRPVAFQWPYPTLPLSRALQVWSIASKVCCSVIESGTGEEASLRQVFFFARTSRPRRRVRARAAQYGRAICCRLTLPIACLQRARCCWSTACLRALATSRGASIMAPRAPPLPALSGVCMCLWCTDARIVTRSHQQGPHFELAVSAPGSCVLVRIELVNLCLLRCAARENQLVMRYAF